MQGPFFALPQHCYWWISEDLGRVNIHFQFSSLYCLLQECDTTRIKIAGPKESENQFYVLQCIKCFMTKI